MASSSLKSASAAAAVVPEVAVTETEEAAADLFRVSCNCLAKMLLAISFVAPNVRGPVETVSGLLPPGEQQVVATIADALRLISGPPPPEPMLLTFLLVNDGLLACNITDGPPTVTVTEWSAMPAEAVGEAVAAIFEAGGQIPLPTPPPPLPVVLPCTLLSIFVVIVVVVVIGGYGG